MEEVRKYLGNWYWGQWFDTDQGKLRVRRSSQEEPKLYICEFENDDGNRCLATFFPCKKTFGEDLLGNAARYEMIPVPLEDIYEKFHFYCTKQYLANGKYYWTV